MSYSVSRLTLYALLSAIEADLRQAVQYYVGDTGLPEQVLGPDFYDKVRYRMLRDMREVEEELSLDIHLVYLDFSDTYQLLNTHKNVLPKHLVQYLQSITNLLDQLVPVRNRVMHSRPLQPEDLSKTFQISDELIKTKFENFWSNLKSTREKLSTDPSYAIGLEIPNYHSEDIGISNNLPIPDFDETGFVGRQDILKILFRQCLGPYPVVSIIGEGGLGKTSLALKVAYDILDMADCPFEAIVWSSSKTTQLTPTEIVHIQGAISDSLGMLSMIAENLSGLKQEDPLEEILNYLEQFRILLILDNLETVLDDRIKEFFSRLPSGSKVLITSRIGLGEFEIRTKLSPLEPSEARALLRALAHVRGVKKLTQVSNEKLENYCRQMQNNPGYIKWFVSAVQVGIRPEEVLQNSELFLEFCMSNVYNHLSEISKRVLTAMLCIAGTRNQAELAFITELSVVELQRALQQLLTTNMITMSSLPTGSTFSSHYEISDLPRDYLQECHPPSPEEYTHYNTQKRRLIAAEERARFDSNQRVNSYSRLTIVTRHSGDSFIAGYLQRALMYAEKHDFDYVNDQLRQAKALAPTHFEVYRVEASIRAAQNNYSAADTAYQRAIALEPNYPPLLYWYGDFLLRHINDVTTALEYLRKAYKLDSSSFEVNFALARAYLYSMKYEETRKILEPLLSSGVELSNFNLRKVHDLFIQTYLRQAENYIEAREFEETLDTLKVFQHICKNMPMELIDSYFENRMQKALKITHRLQRWAAESPRYNEIHEIGVWFEKQISSAIGDDIDSRMTGYIQHLPSGELYGFLVKYETNERIFFHRNDVNDFAEWDDLKVNDIVTFEMGTNNRGPCAINVQKKILD